MTARCDECGQTMAKARMPWREIRGWVQLGGNGEVVLQRATGKQMHRMCMDLRRAKAGQQLSLFDDA